MGLKIGRGIGRDIINRIKSAKNRIWIVSPFISEKYAELLKSKCEEGADVRVITMSRINFNHVRRPRKLAHAKIYVIDDSGFYGSMNLTENGVNENYEIIAYTGPNELPELEKKFLELWEDSVPVEEYACRGVIFEKAWEYEFANTIGYNVWSYNVKSVGDRVYIKTSDELICFSNRGNVLWRVPITSSGANVFGDSILVYRFYSPKYGENANCVKVYLVRVNDGIIESSFDYAGKNPIGVYYDPQERAIGILEKVEDYYEIIGFDPSGNRIDYTGRKDIIFVLPSIVRGDGTVELEIPPGDKFCVSPEVKKIAVVTFSSKRTQTSPREDTIVNIRVYDVDSKSLDKELTVNLGGEDLVDLAVDDEGKVYLLTAGSIYIVENDVQKITIVEKEPMFESPKRTISIRYLEVTKEYYYESCASYCQKVILLGDLICIVLADIFKYRDEYRNNYYAYWAVHVLIYSKKDFRLYQVLKDIYVGKDTSKFGRLPERVTTPQIFLFNDGLVICHPKKIEYFRKVDLSSIVEDFINFLQSVAPILKIDLENYRQTISKLCEGDLGQLIGYIKMEKRNLMQELQIKKSKTEKELAEIVSKVERIIQSGYDTKEVKNLLNLAKDALKNVDKSLLESENKLEILKDVIQKSNFEPTLDVDVKVEKIKINRLYKVTLKFRTNSDLGVIAKVRDVKGNVETHFKKGPIEVCPEAAIDIFLVLREGPPIPVTIEIEYRHFDKVGTIDKILLIS